MFKNIPYLLPFRFGSFLHPPILQHDKTERDVSQTSSVLRQNGWKINIFVFFSIDRDTFATFALIS
jgi:hypothetical protein